MLATISAAFGLLALLLTCIGIYAVVSYAMERRTRELGIRLALGATPSGVQQMMLAELAAVVLPSLLLGAAAALAADRALRTLLFGIAPHDYATVLSAAAVLAAVSAAAAWLPTRRAAHLDPMAALRQE